jgi:hypothetical protein
VLSRFGSYCDNQRRRRASPPRYSRRGAPVVADESDLSSTSLRYAIEAPTESRSRSESSPTSRAGAPHPKSLCPCRELAERRRYDGAEVAERDAAGRDRVRRGGEPFSTRVAERVSSSS